MEKTKQAQLRREYKEARQDAGVYQIKNTVTGRIFIGSSVNVHARINRHKAGFAFIDSHENPRILPDLRAHGKDSFVFEVLEILDGEYDSAAALRDDLKILEEMWLEKLQPFGDNGYNVR